MHALFFTEIEKEIASDLKIQFNGFLTVDVNDMASGLRYMVATAYGQDDAGVEYYYDEAEGIVCIGGKPGWWDSRNPLYIKMLSLADDLDGRDYKFVYAAPCD